VLPDRTPDVERAAQEFRLCAAVHEPSVVAGQAGYANLDPQFTFWVNLSLVALWFAVDSATRQRLIAWALLGLACGMGFMTKGFLAWLLPVLIALPWMLWQNAGANCWSTARWRLSWPSSSACRGSWRCMHRSPTTGGSSSGTSISAASPVRCPA
jgi:hypothetical protein